VPIAWLNRSIGAGKHADPQKKKQCGDSGQVRKLAQNRARDKKDGDDDDNLFNRHIDP
jgi:hypothetical protein